MASIYDSHFFCEINNLQNSIKESFWRSLEEDMIPSSSSMKTNWLDSHGKSLAQKYKESSVCVAGGIKNL